MTIIVRGLAAEKPAATLPHALVRGPRQRAVRGLLEVAHLRAEQRDLLAAALAKARRHRDRSLCHLLEAAILANVDLGAEVDGAGLALGQIGALWSHGEAGGGA